MNFHGEACACSGRPGRARPATCAWWPGGVHSVGPLSMYQAQARALAQLRKDGRAGSVLFWMTKTSAHPLTPCLALLASDRVSRLIGLDSSVLDSVIVAYSRPCIT